MTTPKKKSDLEKPLGDLISETVIAACANKVSRAAYSRVMALFIQFLDEKKGDELAEKRSKLAKKWRPFVESSGKKHKKWTYNAPAAILKWVDSAILDDFLEAYGHLSENTLYTYRAAVRALIRSAHERGIVTEDQVEELGFFLHRSATKKILSNQDVCQMRQSIVRTRLSGKRDLLILDLFLFAGVQTADIPTLSINQIVWDGDHPKYLMLSDDLHIELNPLLAKSLKAWVQAIHDRVAFPDAPLFPDKNNPDPGNQEPMIMSTVTVNRIVARRSNDCRPGDLRRTCGRMAYDNGVSLTIIQRWLRFANRETCARFIGVTEEVEQLNIASHLHYDCESDN